MTAQPQPGRVAVRKLYADHRLGERLTYAMKHRGLSFRQASAEIGISNATVNRIALGKTPDVESFLRVLDWLTRQRSFQPPAREMLLARVQQEGEAG